MFTAVYFRVKLVILAFVPHGENLGLVELLARGCMEIYCFDASGDKANIYRTLGQAIALARTELGVEIAIHPTLMDAADDKLVRSPQVVGTFKFDGNPEEDPAKWPGRLVFAKAGVPAAVAWDVLAYQRHDPQFPSHSTFSQLYTDERFEAYRKLGHHTALRAIATMGSIRGGAGGRRAVGTVPWTTPADIGDGQFLPGSGRIRDGSRFRSVLEVLGLRLLVRKVAARR